MDCVFPPWTRLGLLSDGLHYRSPLPHIPTKAAQEDTTPLHKHLPAAPCMAPAPAPALAVVPVLHRVLAPVPIPGPPLPAEWHTDPTTAPSDDTLVPAPHSNSPPLPSPSQQPLSWPPPFSPSQQPLSSSCAPSPQQPVALRPLIQSWLGSQTERESLPFGPLGEAAKSHDHAAQVVPPVQLTWHRCSRSLAWFHLLHLIIRVGGLQQGDVPSTRHSRGTSPVQRILAL